MEPVFMVLSQSAAVAAIMAIDTRTPVQQIDGNKLQEILKTNPLADKSTAEILVDNDDTMNIGITGEWRRDLKGGYGPSMFRDDGKSGLIKSVQFIPSIIKEGRYKVYAYFPKMAKATSKTSIIVFDGNERKELTVKETDIRVEGQTSGEWVALGMHMLPKGKKSFVEISNKNADGIVVTDAVLFVPDFK